MEVLNILVTGATIGGIGYESAREMAQRGHRLFITSRSLDRARKAAEKIEETTGQIRPEPFALDLSEPDSIGNFVKELQGRTDTIHVLVNNAGFLKRKKHFTASGEEMTMAVNSRGTRALTEALLPLLADGGRIVNVSSIVSALGKKTRGEVVHGFRAYCDSKMAVNHYTRELAGRLADRNITVNALHPGNLVTNIWRDLLPAGKFFETLIGWIDRTGLLSARRGIATVIYLALSAEVEGETEGYYMKCRKMPWPENSTVLP